MSSRSAHAAEDNLPKSGPKQFDQIITSRRRAPKTTVPRVAALLAVISRSRQRLIKTVDTLEFSKALKILKDEASCQLLDSKILNRALWIRSCQKGASDVLIAELIARGCGVNYISSESSERFPVWNSVANGSFEIVRLLVENGADVNYMGSDRTRFFRHSDVAYDFAPRAALKEENIAILRLLLSSGVNINARYKHQGHTSIHGIYLG